MTTSTLARPVETSAVVTRTVPAEVVMVIEGVVMLTAQLPPETETPTTQQMMDRYEEAIRDLAYRLWEEAGCPCCDGLDFWVEAEKIVFPARAAVLPKSF